MDTEAKCPTCGTCDSLSDVTYSDVLQLGGERTLVDGLLSATCANCGAKPLLARHIAHNEALVAACREQQLHQLIGEGLADIEAGRVVAGTEVMQQVRARIAATDGEED